MGYVVIASYRPKAGHDDALLALVCDHHPILVREQLATERAPIIMRSSDGTFVEVFEWRSKEATDAAHTNAAVLAMWERFAAVSDYVPLPQLAESGMLFPGFNAVN